MISLRPITSADEPFLFRVYASTREEELAVVDWGDQQKTAFLHQQFKAQHRDYQQNYAGAAFQVIERGGEPIGRLYVGRWGDEIQIIDISLLPAYRSTGIGTALLRDLLAEAAATGSRITIHVERFNRALRLYERLGFHLIEDRGIYLLLGWSADSQVKIA